MKGGEVVKSLIAPQHRPYKRLLTDESKSRNEC